MWYKIENKNGNQDVYIYEEIGLNGSTTSKELINKLDKMDKSKPLNIRIQSPGGCYYTAVGIANYLKSWKGKVTSYIDGLAASAASYLAINADRVIAYPQSLMLIHSVSTTANGNASDFRQLADNLDKINGQLLQAYIKKSKQSSETVTNWLSKDTWMTAKECFDAGLVDEIVDTSIKCCYTFQNYNLNSKRIEILTDKINRKFGRV